MTVRGRWLIQMVSSFGSTKMPPIWPKIQFFGSGLGQLVSIWNCGTFYAAQTEPVKASAAMLANAMMRLKRAMKSLPRRQPKRIVPLS